MALKEKTLEEVMPNPINRLTLEVSNLNAKVFDITEELKTAIGMNASDIQKLTGRIEAAQEIISDVQTKFDAAVTAMAEVRQLHALRNIANSIEGIHQIKKTYADKMNTKEAAREKFKRDNAGHMDKPKQPEKNDTEYMNKAKLDTLDGKETLTRDSIETALTEKGVNIKLIAISVDRELVIVTPLKFLGDLWGPINTAVREMGGGWIRDGKQSRWEIRDASV